MDQRTRLDFLAVCFFCTAQYGVLSWCRVESLQLGSLWSLCTQTAACSTKRRVSSRFWRGTNPHFCLLLKWFTACNEAKSVDHPACANSFAGARKKTNKMEVSIPLASDTTCQFAMYSVLNANVFHIFQKQQPKKIQQERRSDWGANEDWNALALANEKTRQRCLFKP